MQNWSAIASHNYKDMLNTIALTVAICTYNGEKRLTEVFERLQQQVDVENFSWEILIVDNNSSDRTAELIRAYQINWSICDLVYCFEPQQGLAYARQRALNEAKGKYIGFLDDDNLPDPQWVRSAFAFGETHPTAGAYGSRIYADFAVEPPEGFEEFVSFLGAKDRGEKAFIYQPRKRILPPGAGLVVRQQAWLENVPKQLFLKGRVGKSQLASEDLEALAYIQNGGWEIWHNPQMQITHRIPEFRLQPEYLLAIVRGIGLARYHIRMIRLKIWQRPLLFPLYALNDLRKYVYLWLKYQRHAQKNLATACEMEFVLSSLVSPFYLWKESWSRKEKAEDLAFPQIDNHLQ
ncbi:MAG: hormogonium polysaccharide biosynthesis glycosyltransferase HpsE [Oscillatoria sp. PMC 1051.18]|nr:hormogonium polysaccharide biosynthesis glycosyltransferase HpsE [Oscillatoria sp. PMC 1050.18]MEC5029769.1 hormogonium polysaccharide biosynthesis glycosyltransferase HpsE [Oscillatoria sp. PMC 1051.18]